MRVLTGALFCLVKISRHPEPMGIQFRRIIMKELYLVLKSSPQAFRTLEELKAEGYNATVLSAESLRHAVDYYPEEHHFYTLRHFEKTEMLESILCLFVLKDEDLERVKQTIRGYTNHFKDIKGFMYSRTIEDYEGSL